MVTVLLLEDDEELRQYYEEYLRGYGFFVVARGNSQGVVQLVKEHRANFLVTDLVMPEHEGMEGIFLAKQVPGLKIVAVSSNAAFLRLAENFVDACLLKPIAGLDLILALQRMIQGLLADEADTPVVLKQDQ
jgi:CheY-like chemotaxis protein